MGRSGFFVRFVLAGVLATISSDAVLAQQSATVAQSAPDVASPLPPPILLLDQEALFTRSKFGQALRTRLSTKTAQAKVESQRLDAELEAEERDLTAKRDTMAPTDFAPLASAFDTKVQALRAEQAAQIDKLRAEEVEGRRQFFAVAAQIIGKYMVDRGAVAVLDKSAAIVSLVSLDVTDDVVAQIDTVLGDGSTPTP